jgi:lipid-binding SYLF domain-containing protein
MSRHCVLRSLALCMGLALGPRAVADGALKDAHETISLFKKTDPSIGRFFRGAAGYVVFPTVAKGGAGIGAAHGKGILFQGGKAMGEAGVTQVTIGLQIGGQAYSEIIFFQRAQVLADFERGRFAVAAQASAVAVTAGAAANAKYQDDVAIFLLAKGGLMAEASVGGQKFSYEPFGKKGPK